jgi:hypothetical protein
MLTARLHSVKAKNGRQVYSVIFRGRLLVERSQDPECDAARALLAQGITGKLYLSDAGGFSVTKKQSPGASATSTHRGFQSREPSSTLRRLQCFARSRLPMLRVLDATRHVQRAHRGPKLMKMKVRVR